MDHNDLAFRILDIAADLESLAHNLRNTPLTNGMDSELDPILEDAYRFLSAHFETAANLADD